MNAGRACLFNRQRALFINGNAVNSCFSQSFRHDAALSSQDIAYGPLFSSVSGAGTLNDDCGTPLGVRNHKASQGHRNVDSAAITHGGGVFLSSSA